MSAPAERRRPSRAAVIRVTAFVVALAALVTGAVVAQGFDVKQAPVRNPSVWAINQDASTGSQKYARVNTDLAELDTVKPATAPTSIVQTSDSVLLLTDADLKYGEVDPAQPQDFATDDQDLRSAPAGTQSVVSTGAWMAFLSNAGAVSAAVVRNGTLTTPFGIDPFASTEPDAPKTDAYSAVALAIGTDGTLYAYSAQRSAVLAFDLVTGKIVDETPVTGVPADPVPTLTAVGSEWVLVAGTATLWTRAHADGVAVDLGGPDTVAVESPAASGDSVYLATVTGLFEVALSDLGVTTPVEPGPTLGTPAAPRQFEGVVYAAWLPAGGTGGTYWHSDADGTQPLSFGTATGGAAPAPVFRTNGTELILNDDSIGWVWTIDGALVPSSQDWNAGDPDQTQIGDDAEVTQILDPLPPIAENDTFGVRPGAFATLPVLLNDHDPNEDVLTIVPGSLTGLDPSFGELSITTELERISIRVAPDAPAHGTFQYVITDGVDGHTATATVTLDRVDDATETAPVWCGNDPICAEVTPWPSIQVAPGGSARADVLTAWVDPESDPVYVSAVTKKNPDDPGSVAVTEDGSVFFQHPDAGAGTGAPITLVVTVADARGLTASRELTVAVTSTPALTVAPFSIVTQVGRPLVIDPAAHITGGTGVFTLANATTADESAQVAVGANGTTIDFTAPNPGTYVVRYDVSDSATTGLSTTLRVTVLPDDQLQLATAPITVFVRPKLDTTVDVFAAVANPADRLLVLVSAQAHQNGSDSLFADVVGHRLLRVKGATAGGGPGVLGTVDYTVSDGTADSARTVTGVATVILLDDQDAQRPIAVDDSVVVRAGAQVDVPVLANDVSTDGNALVLDPSADAITTTADGGLAFASRDAVRILAPETDGQYTIQYTVYSAGAPAKADTGQVLVTVVPEGENQKPQPRTLDARVAAGQTVTVPVDSNGVDPDGDAVLLSRVVGQPSHGTASIAASGDSIRYTALDATYSGTDEFQYEVRDSHGAVGVGTVRVGILGTQESSAPVTFTDYVQVEQGDNTVVVEPLANDIDPLGGALTLQSFVPDLADPASPQYVAQAALITTIDGGTVTLSAGDVAGTNVFAYTASTADGLNSATGYVVVKVVPTAVPDAPQITDSYVSVSDRATFENDGLDVVAGHVQWISGDASTLALTLWHPPAGYSVTGHRIAGPLPATTTLVAFSLSGQDYQGRDVVSYGFLLVPGENDIILALDPNAAAVQVDENSETTFDISSMVAVPRGATLEVDPTGIAAVLRPAATCVLESGYTIRYTAGQGAPYADACVVPVRLAGQDFSTPLLVPIQVEAEAPIPLLKDASRDVIPDPQLAPQTIDLMSMVTWAGLKTDDPNVAFDVSLPDPTVFDSSYDPATRVVTFAAKGSAVPGTRASIVVRFAGPTYGTSTEQGTIALTVGATPNQLPRGGSTSTECSIPDGPAGCSVSVIGLPGEYNYFADAGALKVVQLQPSTCPGVTFSIAGGASIRASWSGEIDGVECTVGFVVEDQAGTKHRSTGDGNGTVTWRFNGLPRAPASVTQVAYDDGRIQLAVDPGDARSAFPALTGFEIVRDGGKEIVATCGATGACTVIRTNQNLDHHQYTAYAVNSEGRSLTAPSVEAWSYALPTLGRVTVDPVYDPAITSRTTGAVRITITGSEQDVTAYDLNQGSGTLARSGDSTTATLAYPVGKLDLTITPVTSSGPPDAQGPTATDAANSSSITVAGSPAVTANGTASSGETSVTLSGAAIDANRSARPTQAVYYAYRSAAPTCAVDASGGNPVVSGGDAVVSNTTTVSGLDSNLSYQVGACLSNGYGFAMTQPRSAFTAKQPVTPSSITYTVEARVDGNGYNTDGDYTIVVDEAAAQSQDRLFTPVWTNYDPNRNQATITGSDPQISVKYCAIYNADYCSAPIAVTPVDNAAAYQMQVDGQSGVSCVAGSPLRVTASGIGSLGAVSILSATFYDGSGTELTGIDPNGTIPNSVHDVRNVKAIVTWYDGSPVANLPDYTWGVGNSNCLGYVAPTPTPTPTP